MEILQNQLVRPSYRDVIKGLEADIQHANTLAAAVSRAYGKTCLQMRLAYSPLAAIFLYLMEWIDYNSCTHCLPRYLGLPHILIYKVYDDGNITISAYERKAGLGEFYAVIYPSLQQLESEVADFQDTNHKGRCTDILSRMRTDERQVIYHKGTDRDDECGICLEPCTKIVLPNCNHAMCLNSFRDWNLRSQSCPFCRGSLKRVKSTDLWVLTSYGDVADAITLAKENLRRFYVYIDSLPLTIPDSLFLVYYDYVI